MKTTIEISDPLFDRTRKLAAREGTTFRAIVEQSLQSFLDGKASAKPFKLRDGSFKGEFSEEYREGGWDAVRRAIYEDHGG